MPIRRLIRPTYRSNVLRIFSNLRKIVVAVLKYGFEIKQFNLSEFSFLL